MVKTWKENTNYYLEMPAEALNTPIDIATLSGFGYPESIDKIPKDVIDYYGITTNITLGMLLMTHKVLSDDGVTPNEMVAFNIQISPYVNFIKFSSCAKDKINKGDFEMAKLMYKVSGFMDEKTYIGLKTAQQ